MKLRSLMRWRCFHLPLLCSYWRARRFGLRGREYAFCEWCARYWSERDVILGCVPERVLRFDGWETRYYVDEVAVVEKR